MYRLLLDTNVAQHIAFLEAEGSLFCNLHLAVTTVSS